MISSFSSVASAASTAAREPGRPTDSGISRCGKRTVFFKGRTGSIFISSVSLTGSPLRLHADKEDSISELQAHLGVFEIARQVDRSLESVVGDLHEVVVAPLFQEAVAPRAGDRDPASL